MIESVSVNVVPAEEVVDAVGEAVTISLSREGLPLADAQPLVLSVGEIVEECVTVGVSEKEE